MRQRFLEAGEVVGTHGVKGEIELLPWADGPEFLLGFDTLYLNGEPREVEASRIHKSLVLCKLRGVDSIEAAQALRGKVVTVDRTGLELAEGTVFIADLLGLPVFSEGKQIGALQDVLTLPGNDVYVVEGDGMRWMIPAVSEFLEKVDVDAGEIHVKLIEGMGEPCGSTS